MKRYLFGLAVSAALAVFAPAAYAEPVLGKIETLYLAMSRNVLVEFTPGMRTHDRPIVAEVRLRDATGAPARRVFVRLDGEAVEAGDVVAVSQGERVAALHAAPLRSVDRVTRIEAKHDTELARRFFRPASPSFLALKDPD
jgi:hypothetical protein